MFKDLPYGCKAFGKGASRKKIERWLRIWSDQTKDFVALLVLAGSRTAEVEGISAAGVTADSRRYTALADAEFLLYGGLRPLRWQLPALEAGISPALISYVASRFLGVSPLVLAVGLSKQPSFPHLRIDLPSFGPANCLSTGHSMEIERVQLLWERGFSMGLRLRKPLLLAECVPGGTTTAQAVLTGLGMHVENFVSSSVKNPPFGLKKELVERGLRASGIGLNASPKELLAAIGDPFQPVAAGMVLGAREAGQEVLLGGGSQMLAVLALALAEISPSQRLTFVDGVAIGTTSWLAQEITQNSKNKSSLLELINLVGEHFDVPLLGLANGLHFDLSDQKVLRDYEAGYIKEGVGAGAFVLLAQLNGTNCQELTQSCDEVVEDFYNRASRWN